MSGQNGSAAEEEASPSVLPARILIHFRAEGVTAHDIIFEGVTAEQVYLAAWALDAAAREVRVNQTVARAIGRPVLPADGLADVADLLMEALHVR